jgi:hypothetical protein
MKIVHDPHRQTAAKIFGVPEAAVNAEQRRFAKMVNFELVYGMPPEDLRALFGPGRQVAVPKRGPALYVASRARVPQRPQMWRRLRDRLGWNILSTWIDEADEGATQSFEELWARIEREITASDALMLYARPEDFPLKGALIEVGMALALGKPVAVVLGPGLELEGCTKRPLGSWVDHPSCHVFNGVFDAYDFLARHCANSLLRTQP